MAHNSDDEAADPHVALIPLIALVSVLVLFIVFMHFQDAVKARSNVQGRWDEYERNRDPLGVPPQENFPEAFFRTVNRSHYKQVHDDYGDSCHVEEREGTRVTYVTELYQVDETETNHEC